MRCTTGFRAAVLGALLAVTGSVPLGAQEDPGAGRGVARISLINGDVSVRRGDSGDWVAAAPNAPLVVDDRIATGSGSRAEVQFDSANLVRLAQDSEVRFTELSNRRYLMQVPHGTVSFSVLRNSDAYVEVSTPAVSVRPQVRGEYRVSVREDGSVEVTARSGEVEVYTPRGVERVRAGTTMEVRGTESDPEFQIVAAIPRDEWDQWNEQRDQNLERSQSYRYVSRDVYGVEDLDSYGSWVDVPGYGYCWRPVVVAGWAPYRMGRWSWIDYYGWSWVSYDPWGWAPYHYGRWFYGQGGWCWWPGGIGGRHYWSPALVGFFGWGGGGVGIGFGNFGWVPLAPYERFYPWYGRGFYGGYGNRRFANIANINIYNSYRNARFANGITGVRGADFGRGSYRNFRSVSANEIRQASSFRGQLPMGPGRESVRFTDRAAHVMRQGNDNQRFFSRARPAQVQRVSFAQQRQSFERASTGSNRGSSMAQGPGGGLNGRQAGRSGAVADAGQSRGWRRFGDPVGANQARSAQSGGPGRSGGAAGMSRGGASASPRAESNGANGWRRLGGSSSGQAAGARSNGARTQASPRGEGAPARGWSHFGDPRASDSGPARGSARPEGSQRFGGPNQNYRGSQAESLRVSPPVVRERGGNSGGSYSAPRSNPYSSGGDRGYSAPRSAPRDYRSGGGERGYSAPRSYSGGGGGYSAPRSSGGGGGSGYSAPRSSGGGGDSRGSSAGGGGGSRGGGGSHGGGGGRGRR